MLSPLSFRLPHRNGEFAPDFISTPGLFPLPELITNVHDKELLRYLKLSNDGDIYLEALAPDQCGHRSLELANTFNDQNPHALTSTMVRISFQLQPHHPLLSRKLGTNPMHY